MASSSRCASSVRASGVSPTMKGGKSTLSMLSTTSRVDCSAMARSIGRMACSGSSKAATE
jgi:hypothetical protein